MEVNSETNGDLTILRSKTSDKLEVDNDYPTESALLTVIRMLYSCFIVLSFILFTSPRSQVVNGVSLDATMNITVIGNTSLFLSIQASSSVDLNSTLPDFNTEKVDAVPTFARAVKTSQPQRPKAFKLLHKAMSNNNDQDSDASSCASPPLSILAVPALFGKPMNTHRIVAPMLALDIDACTPFMAKFPNEKPWVKKITQLNRQASQATRSNSFHKTLLSSKDSSSTLEAMADFFHSLFAMDQTLAASNPPTHTSSPTAKHHAYSTARSKSILGGASMKHGHASPPVENKSDAPASILTEDNPHWVALVARGNCPFDVKIYNAEQAGFHGIVIHNRVGARAGGAAVDVPVRMSANKLGAQVQGIRAMFITQQDGDQLVAAAMRNAEAMPRGTTEGLFEGPVIAAGYGSRGVAGLGVVGAPLAVSMELDAWPVDGWGSTGAGGLRIRRRVFSTLSFLGNALLLVGIFMLCGGICTAICLFFIMIRNYFVHGRFFVLIFAPSFNLPRWLWNSRRAGNGGHLEAVDTEEGSIPHDGTEGGPVEELLEQVVLPLYVIEAEDLVEDGDVADNNPVKSIEADSEYEDQLCTVNVDECLVTSTINEVPALSTSTLSKRKRSTAAGGTRKCCAICIEEFAIGSKVRELPCHHQFHNHCIDPWLLRHNRLCPICKRDVLVVKDRPACKKISSPQTSASNISSGRWWVISRSWLPLASNEHNH